MGLVGVAVAALVLGVAAILDEPTGPKPQTAAASAPDDTSPLPPLATALDRPFPKALAGAPLEEQVLDLERRVAQSRSPERLVDLAVGYQKIGQPERGAPLLQEALRADPELLTARVAVIMQDAAIAPESLRQAQTALEKLAREAPKSQLVAFNLALIGLYRSDLQVFFTNLERTQDLDPASNLGVTAGRLLTVRDETSTGVEP